VTKLTKQQHSFLKCFSRCLGCIQ